MDQRRVGMAMRRRLGAPASHLAMANQGLAFYRSQQPEESPDDEMVDHLRGEHGYSLRKGDFYHEQATARPMTQSPSKFHDFEHANYPFSHSH